MTIVLNHTIVPARDKRAAARSFAEIFGLQLEDEASGHFAPVRVNENLTLLFDEDDAFESHHYAFHVSEGSSIPSFAASRQPASRTAALPGAWTTASSTTGTA